MRIISLLLTAFLLVSCTEKPETSDNGGDNTNPPETSVQIAKGADIGWVTEMETQGYKFYNDKNFAKELTALLKEMGFNAIRHRVWVNPKDGWCNKEDLLVKARRVRDLGLDLMVDFHYSDSWADPGKQPVPAAWKDYTTEELAAAVVEHTTDVLSALKAEGIDVKWVQVGNETNTGMMCHLDASGKTPFPAGGGVSTANKGANFIMFANAAYDAIKAIYPDATVILHHSNAHDLTKNQWFYDIMKAGGAKYDMIGLSLYPSYFNESQGAYPDWKPYTNAAIANVETLHKRYDKPVMLVEFGMPASQPEETKAALELLFEKTKDFDWFKGIFYWEPESERSRNNYDYGAFSYGHPTAGLDPFRN